MRSARGMRPGDVLVIGGVPCTVVEVEAVPEGARLRFASGEVLIARARSRYAVRQRLQGKVPAW